MSATAKQEGHINRGTPSANWNFAFVAVEQTGTYWLLETKGQKTSE
ncbi:MAG TPA: hypothetical protein VF515_22515 [Candidatus Binatia bacterium]